MTLFALGCPDTSPPDERPFDPTLVESDDLYLWQGFHHSWLYNHRWGRMGSGFVRTDPALEEVSYPVTPEPWESPISDTPAWTYMGSASAGTGKDLGTHVSRAVVVEDAPVEFASLTARRRIRGPEGKLVRVEPWTIEATLPESLVGVDRLAVVLNGFWMTSVGDEAKQPYRIRLAIDEVTVTDDTLAVNVDVVFGFDCDTPECNGCRVSPTKPASDDFAYDLEVALAVVGGSASAVVFERLEGPPVEAAWDGPPAHDGDDACLKESDDGDCVDYWVECGDLQLSEYSELPATAGRVSVSASTDQLPVGLVGVTGFDLELDEPHHTLEVELGVDDVTWEEDVVFSQILRFQNWRYDMNVTGQDTDPLSATAFGTSGSYSGNLSFLKIGLSEGTLEERRVEEMIITERGKTVVVPMDEDAAP